MADVKQIEVNGVTYYIHDATARSQIADLQQSVDQEVTTGLYLHKLAGWCLVRFAGYNVTEQGGGQAGSIGFIPAMQCSNAVSVEGNGIGVIAVLSDGTMTLYSSTMESYMTGIIHGSIIVPMR